MSVLDARAFRSQVTTRRVALRRARGLGAWQVVVAVAAVVAAAAAVWLTLAADFLAYPGWLAAQKADLILGPVFVGLYWLRRRPESRFGPLLIVFGFVCAVYILQSSSDDQLFAAGVVWEAAIYLGTLLLILTFPTGRLDGLAARLIVAAGALFVAIPGTVAVFLLPQAGADGSISGCRALCPRNGLLIASSPSTALDIVRFERGAIIAVALATGALLIWRLATGTPPRRRALAIGAPVALVFTAAQIAYQGASLATPGLVARHSVSQWTVAGARALLWYGFLFALIAAQLFAGRALHRLVRQSLRRPSPRELEEMLREPLGDPGLRLVFPDARTGAWSDGFDGGPPRPPPGREITLVERDGRPAVAIVHDAQLDDDPELLRAAGAVALLAADNTQLDTAWQAALLDLRESRARIVVAGDDERRKLERNLHDGVQQRLVAIRINVGLTGEVVGGDAVVGGRLEEIGDSLEQAIDELREVAHGLYPPVLTDLGIVAALGTLRRNGRASLTIDGGGVGRHSPDLESAIYYCCLEAIQNATKHGGAGARIAVVLREDDRRLRFEVSDDGPGFDPVVAHLGTGLQNMRDRLGALDGRLSIVSGPGQRTVVAGSVPLRRGAPA
jgi:signal transduction histidine kinase